jgi:hypothetical protein
MRTDKQRITAFEIPVLSAKKPAARAARGLSHILPTPTAPPKTTPILKTSVAYGVK